MRLDHPPRFARQRHMHMRGETERERERGGGREVAKRGGLARVSRAPSRRGHCIFSGCRFRDRNRRNNTLISRPFAKSERLSLSLSLSLAALPRPDPGGSILLRGFRRPPSLSLSLSLSAIINPGDVQYLWRLRRLLLRYFNLYSPGMPPHDGRLCCPRDRSASPRAMASYSRVPRVRGGYRGNASTRLR